MIDENSFTPTVIIIIIIITKNSCRVKRYKCAGRGRAWVVKYRAKTFEQLKSFRLVLLQPVQRRNHAELPQTDEHE